MSKTAEDLTLVPVTEFPICEPRSKEEICSALAGLMDESPGFVVRADWAPILTENDGIKTILKEATGERYRGDIYQPDIADLLGTAYVGVGRLHEDSSSARPGENERIVFHRTMAGVGKVSLANSGARYGRILEESPHGTSGVHINIGNHLKGGLTVPGVMRPEIHTAILTPNDMVVFPLRNKLGPVWHRFDTHVEPRAASAFALVPASTQK